MELVGGWIYNPTSEHFILIVDARNEWRWKEKWRKDSVRPMCIETRTSLPWSTQAWKTWKPGWCYSWICFSLRMYKDVFTMVVIMFCLIRVSLIGLPTTKLELECIILVEFYRWRVISCRKRDDLGGPRWSFIFWDRVSFHSWAEHVQKISVLTGKFLVHICKISVEDPRPPCARVSLQLRGLELYSCRRKNGKQTGR